MDSNQMNDHEKELRHRLLAAGISDGEFLERLFKRHDVRRSLQNASNRGPAAYEEELEVLVEIAEDDYHHYGLAWFGHTQGGDIPPKQKPKTRQKAGKAKDTAEAWERQEALGQYLARVASENGRITDFRKNCLAAHYHPNTRKAHSWGESWRGGLIEEDVYGGGDS